MLEENRFENVLASLRVRKGWTQEDAAAHTGMSRHTYSDLETGNRPPSEKHLKLIATGFKLDPADIDALYHAAHHGSPKICHLPFDRNLLFTGRNTYLKQLDELFKAGNSIAPTQRIVISGLPGIGKTQLALEYAYRCFPDVYQAVFWVNAADEETLLTGYGRLAQILELPERDEQNLYKLIDAVKQWLGRHRHWLLIMDNADNLQLARSFFPEDHQGRILLTTRSQIISNIATPIMIEQMPLAEGRLFLLRRSGALRDKAKPDDVSVDTLGSATQLVELLDGHPLALDQAGAYIEEGASFTEYIELYKEKRIDLLRRRGSQDRENDGKYSEYPASVAATFELCFAKAQEYHLLATDILRFCAFLHPDIIPDELFQHDDSFKSDITALIDGRTALLRYSLIKRNALDYTLPWDRLENTLSMHRLVQDVIIDAMSADLQRQWRERVVRALNAAFPEKDSDFYFGNLITQCRRLLPHVLLCAAWTDDELAQTVVVAKLLYKAASYLQDRYQHSDAEPLQARVLQIYEKHIGVGHTITASELCSLAALCKYDQAEALYQQALAVGERHLGADHPDIAYIMHNLALLYMNHDKYDQTEQLLKQVLSFREKHLGADHPDTFTSLHSLASLYFEQRKYDQAEALYRRGLAIREQYLGSEHPDTARSLYNLAVLYYEQCKDEQAVSLFLQVLKIWGQHPEADFSITEGLDGIVHALAALLSWQGKHEQSEAYYQILDRQAQQFQDQQYGMKTVSLKVIRTDPIDRSELYDNILKWDMG